MIDSPLDNPFDKDLPKCAPDTQKGDYFNGFDDGFDDGYQAGVTEGMAAPCGCNCASRDAGVDMFWSVIAFAVLCIGALMTAGVFLSSALLVLCASLTAGFSYAGQWWYANMALYPVPGYVLHAAAVASFCAGVGVLALAVS